MMAHRSAYATGALTLALGALVIAGCGRKSDNDAPPEPRAKAERHPEKKLLVNYGALPYRVNVRYVGMIGQSVIAVRRGSAEGVAEGWEQLAVKPTHAQPSDVPFESDTYREVAIDIANAVGAGVGICPNGTPMQLSVKDEGEARTMYRGERQAWVVFARCVQQAEG